MDAFGETKSIESKNNFQFNLRFAGQYYDNETGYHYNAHRYYNPQTGRYLTADPLGLSGGLNSYVYANHEPWEYVDVLGLYTIQDASKELSKHGVKRLGSFTYTVNSPIGEMRFTEQCWSDEQLFNAWLKLERSNTAWLKDTWWGNGSMNKSRLRLNRMSVWQKAYFVLV